MYKKYVAGKLFGKYTIYGCQKNLVCIGKLCAGRTIRKVASV
jgi:hypothetical protein